MLRYNDVIRCPTFVANSLSEEEKIVGIISRHALNFISSSHTMNTRRENLIKLISQLAIKLDSLLIWCKAICRRMKKETKP